jgi:glutathionylspermidine synthase
VEVNLTNRSLEAKFEYDASAVDLLRYKLRRERFYLDSLSLWPGTLLDCNDLLDVYALPSTEIAAITQAAAAIARIYQRTANLLRTLPDDVLLQMGLPPETVNISRLHLPAMPDTVIGRLDLVKTTDGYRMLEFNADNPGLLIETFPMNATVCNESGKINPNQQGEAALIRALQDAIAAGLAYVGKTRGEQSNVVFTCRSTYLRDLDITQYLMGLVALPECIQKKYVPLELLRADEQGLYDPNGNQIDLVYRFHPLQFFCGGMFRDHDGDNDGMYDGALLYDLVLRRKLAIINPPSAFMIENKAVQSIIWGLSESNTYFTAAERRLIRQHFLPTYMDPVFSDEPYVVKPVYGSEGDTVTIVDPKKGDVFKTTTSTYMDQPMVYQKYVELPKVELMTEHGMQSLSLLTSCFLINGQPVGITLRAGEAVTDFSWRSVPVCVA